MLDRIKPTGACARHVLVATCGVLLSGVAGAQGIIVYEDGDTAVELGGRIQVQYLRVDPDTAIADSTDDLFLRRFYLETEATLTENWGGKFQIDFADDVVDIKDAYIVYEGFTIGDIYLGNRKVPFAREQLTSSRYQQLVERTFVGDNNFGVPQRQVGISLQGGEQLGYWLGYYKAGIDPATDAVDFDTRLLQEDVQYFGDMIAGRIDLFPISKPFEFEQGDFERTGPRLGIGLNAYSWWNDEDNVNESELPLGSDYDEITGYGADAQLKFVGFDINAAYQTFRSETVDPAFTDGLIAGGEGDFDTYAVEGGYMIPVGSDFVEPVFGYQVLDADAVAKEDRRISVGVNYFFNKHIDKVQFTYERGMDVFATDNAGNRETNETAIGDDQDRLFLQFQHLF